MRDLVEREIRKLIEKNKELINSQEYAATVFIYNKETKIADIDIDKLPDYILLEIYAQMWNWGKGATA